MPLPLTGIMQRGAVYGMYQSLIGKTVRPGDITTGWLDRDRDQTLSEREVAEAFGRDRMVVSLRQAPGMPPVFQRPDMVAERVAESLDEADGRQDGWVEFSGTSSQQPNPTWPGRRVQTYEVARNLASGDWVIGEHVMERREALNRGMTVTEFQAGATAWQHPADDPVLVQVLH